MPYTVKSTGGEVGFRSLLEVDDALRNGLVDLQDLIREDGADGTWQTVGSLPAFAKRKGAMKSERTLELPLFIRIAAWVSFYNLWVVIEETVIDRHGLWKYLPLYRYQNFCAWDVAAIVGIGAGVFWAARRWSRRGHPPVPS